MLSDKTLLELRVPRCGGNGRTNRYEITSGILISNFLYGTGNTP